MTDQKTPTLPQTDMSAAETARRFLHGVPEVVGGHDFQAMLTIAELSKLTGRKMLDLTTEAMKFGLTVTVNQRFDVLPLLLALVAAATPEATEAEQSAALSAPPAPVVAIDAGGQEAVLEANGRLGVALALLTECLDPLEVSAAIIESEDGGEAIETLIQQVRKFVAAVKRHALVSHTEAPPASAPPVAAVAQPMFFVSPKQAHALEDHPGDNEGGRYLPVRKTKAGNFTMPLYAAPAVVAQPVTDEQIEHAWVTFGTGGYIKFARDVLALAASPIAPQAGQAGEEKGRG